jgi:Leucine-rich repeat (LRR) protein
MQYKLWSIFPTSFSQDLDLAQNALTGLPSQLAELKQLRKLDLSFNKLTKAVIAEGAFEQLEVLNLSGNELQASQYTINSLNFYYYEIMNEKNELKTNFLQS